MTRTCRRASLGPRRRTARLPRALGKPAWRTEAGRGEQRIWSSGSRRPRFGQPDRLKSRGSGADLGCFELRPAGIRTCVVAGAVLVHREIALAWNLVPAGTVVPTQTDDRRLALRRPHTSGQLQRRPHQHH